MPTRNGPKPLKLVSGTDAGTTRHRLRILLADDDRDTALTLATILRDEGDEVHTVLRGDEVLEVARLFRPDVLILDVNMPGMSGYAIAHEVRDRSGVAAPLLIAISGVWTGPADRVTGKAVGFDHYLVKPCEPGQLLALLEPLRSGQQKDGEKAG